MKNKIGYVYLTTNLVNGKQYVGQHIANKFDKSYKGSGNAIKSAFKKYGWNNFKCKIICWCSTQKELNYREHCEIVFHSTFSPNGYNLKCGGSHGKLRKETIEKMRKANKGKKLTEETKTKISIALKGKKREPLGEKWRKNVSIGHKGQVAWNKGLKGIIKHSEETCKKISESNKGKHKPPVWMMGKNKGTHLTNEEKKANQLSQPNRKVVYQYDKNYNLIKIWDSIREAGRAGFDSSCVSACCNGKKHCKTYKGFVWSYTPLE